ncbi:Tyrosine-protein kinase etk [Polaribacter huanghezhanensis]|uniref:GumC family protein n=1 Tax=Polaribacter huanghezhanensis TaxID=1354726 RepID=UPI0026478B65|nr:polysaccharide biosynthesis tyrosine autokinase [Polaribacter huanghezhanensis]WKD86837.1 Tyrosine-protein kinase etk [Polaribacter huanghezhanensis]
MRKRGLYENNSQENSIDIKTYVFKIIGYWKLFIVTTIIALIVAKFLNGYKEKLYSLNTVISVKEENNPLFSTGTNIAFNWGGESHEIGTVKVILKSRTHNEKVVESLQFYIDYLKEGRYRLEDVYGSTPFKIKVELDKPQLYDNLIKIEGLGGDKYKVSFDYNTEGRNALITYTSNIIEKGTGNTFSSYASKEINFSGEYFSGEKINLPFLNFTIHSVSSLSLGEFYFIKFSNFDTTVKGYRSIKISDLTDGASILELKLEGSNKNRIVDYLNASVKVLEKDKKSAKIAYAENTKKYIDNLFKIESGNLKNLEKELSKFKSKNNIYNLSAQGSGILEKITLIDSQKRNVTNNIELLDSLNNYVLTHKKFNKIPVPAIIEIADGKIPIEVGELISKTTVREKLRNTVTDNHPDVIALDKDIETTKKILLENIRNLKSTFKNDLKKVNSRLSVALNKQKMLPEKEQGLIAFERSYNMSEANYNYLKQKSYEAGTAIAANVSDVKIIDTAKDLDNGPIYPIPSFNYLLALMVGLVLPLFYIIILESLDSKIHSVEEIERTYAIPVLGVIGKNNWKNNLAVFERPKSSVAESFRALRSNVKFLFNTNKSDSNSKTILITSSVSGEGKTMVSINMASVFALSGKKTVLIGLDLRKPKIFSDFGLGNERGVVNFLIGHNSIEDVTVNTKVPNLDLILSGPIPPNPSELLISDNTDELMNYLKEKYDYIIIDSPPIGLVSDALELFKYTDAIMYVIRQNYSEKGMMKMIDDKYKNKEVANISYVLNDFSLQGKYGYGYSYGYGYGKYGNGYHEEEEKGNLFLKIIKMLKP